MSGGESHRVKFCGNRDGRLDVLLRDGSSRDSTLCGDFLLALEGAATMGPRLCLVAVEVTDGSRSAAFR
jgi:hypothetical protein